MIRSLHQRQLFTGVFPKVFVVAPNREFSRLNPALLTLVDGCEAITRAVSARTKALRWARMLA